MERQGNLPNLGGAWVEGKRFGAGDDKTAADVLRRIRREARDETEKGEWFEELFMRIARTVPELAVAAIHRWRTWPDRLRLTGLDGRDIGVDLVAELTDGTLAAVQCKCYAETHTVGKKEIDSFLSASEAECFGHRWIVSTAKPGPNAAAAVEAARPSVSWIDFRLYLDRPVDKAAEVRPIRELLSLQQEAVDVTVEGLANHDRGTLVMACGTGKTFTALRIAERIVPDGGAILFTAPSIALVSQARREWLRHCVKPLLSLVVCSDPSAGGKGANELVKARTTRELRREHGRTEASTSIDTIHLDASSSAGERKFELDRLRDAGGPGRETDCRIICNCRLFSEGVDIPNLTSVAFLDGKKSQIDVVQAVGRVMRRAEGKDLGYVVVPVVVEEGEDITVALERTGSEGYKTVGQVLKALQAHDERLMDDLEAFVQIHEAKTNDRIPGEEKHGRIQDVLDLAPVDGRAIYAHVAAASGLNRRGMDEADDIGETVKAAARTIGAAGATQAVADALGITVEATGGPKTVDRIGALLITNACLLEQRLRTTTDVGHNLGRDMTEAADDPIGEMRAAWELILERDYAPVFKPALAVLSAVKGRTEVRRAVRTIHRTATRLATGLSELGYDYAGPLYHRILGTATSDGAFYTKSTSAVMLARLALGPGACNWADPEAVRKLRIMDPACGTGSLLMAAVQTIKDRAAQAGGVAPNDPEFHRTIVEDMICGLDINAHAVQLAACNLTLGAPTVDYRRMNVARAPHGPQENGKARLGAIEMLRGADEANSLAGIVYGTRGDTPEGSEHVDSDGEFQFPARDLDVVIMNPPFSSNQNRSEKFSETEKKAMQARENETKIQVEHQDPLAGAVITANSVSTFFTPLAEQALRKGGVLAKILPVTACTSAGGLAERRFLADRFHIDRIITSHDPKSPNFSEKPVGIHEALLIARRRDGGAEKPTEFISLARMPGHGKEPARAILDAQAAAEDILARQAGGWGTVCQWPADRMKSGDWTAAQWYDGGLAEAARNVEHNALLEPAGLRYAIGPDGRSVQDAYEIGEPEDSGAIPGFHSVSGELRGTILGEADVWYIPRRRPRRNMERWIEQTSTQRNHMLVAMKMNTMSGRLSGLWSETPSFGWWVPVSVTDDDTAKALAAWWNSTPVRLMLLNRRARTLIYPMWQVAHLREIRIPKPDNPAWSDLRNAFEEVKHVELLPMSQAERCQARLVIDRAAAKALGTSEDTMADWRRRLALEPTVSNKHAATARTAQEAT